VSGQVDYELAALITKLIEEYAEAYNTQFNDILITMDYIYACLERYADKDTAPHKMH
jgi:hypothetical protein